MAGKVLDGVIVRIEARHDFNNIMAERVFVPGSTSAMTAWVNQTVEILMAKAKKEDPTFDAYEFAAVTTPIVVEMS